MAQGKLRGRVRACRDPNHGGTRNAQGVQRGGEDVCLRRRRGIGWQRGAQVAKAGDGDDTETFTHGAVRESHPLVEPARGPVYHDDRRPVPLLGQLDRPAGGRHHAASASRPTRAARISARNLR